MKKQLFIFLGLVLFLPLLLLSQDANKPDTTMIRVMAKAYGDSIVIRWAPSTSGAWQLLNKTGYQVLRLEKNNVDGKWTVLNTRPVIALPWT